MEYTIVNGDITKTDCVDMICHQVNCKGVMGSGVAKAIRDKWNIVYNEYNTLCKSVSESKKLLGTAQYVHIYNSSNPKRPYYVCNIFAQDSYGYSGKFTSYDAFRIALRNINENCKGFIVAFPWKIGCARGGGDWDIILPMICDELSNVKELIFYRIDKE